MVSLISLVLPTVLSAVLVFVASFLIHMVLGYHRNDLWKLPGEKEDQVLDALRRMNVSPGEYGVPHPGGPQGMKDPAFVAKMTKGPVVLLTVSPGAPPAMGTNLMLWFFYTVLVGFFAAYIASRAVAPGGDYLTVFRFVGTTAFMGYSLGLPPESIWYKRRWSRTFKSMFDGLIYALLTAGVFGWLWPRA